MCGPPALALAAAGVAAAGQIAGGISQASQLRYQARVAEQNAQLQNQQALDAIERGKIERVQLDRKYASLQGEQQAAMAANGIDQNFGSASQVASDTASLRNEDATSLYTNQYQELRGHDISAANYRTDATAKRQAASGAIISAAFGAASTALGGASQFSRLKAPGRYGAAA